MGQDRGLVEAEHPQVWELLAAWALGACGEDEADGVREHIAACTICAAEADRLRQAAAWLGAGEELPPSAGLRDSVLAAARRRRRPAPGTRASGAQASAERAPAEGAEAHAAGTYAAAVVELDELLVALAPEQWAATVVHGWRVPELVAHLAANDATLAAELELPAAHASRPAPPVTVRAAWRAQADSVLRLVEGGGAAALDRRVRLVGPWEPRYPLHQALVQRAFETWIHAEDIRTALGRPAGRPDPRRVARIAALGVRLLPLAMRLQGLEHPGRTARLLLGGQGGGEWTLPLSPRGQPGPPDVTIGIDAVEFCYLIGNRRTVGSLRYTVDGDRALALDLLRAATTLGCD